MFNWLAEWITPLFAIVLVILVIVQFPRSFWRPVMARAGEAGPVWWLSCSLLALASWGVAGWFAMRIVEGRELSASTVSPLAALDYAFGFLKAGFVGGAENQLNMQAAVIWGAAAIACGYLAVRLRHTLFSLDIEYQPDAPPRRVIVMGLSDLKPGTEAAIEKLASLSIAEAATADVGLVSWQQNLRLLNHHCARALLKRPRRFLPWTLTTDPRSHHVVILPSHETRDLVPRFVALAEKCLDKGGARHVVFHAWSPSVDYEDLRAIQDGLKAIIRWVCAEQKIDARLHEISIDTTAGQKVFSIGGSAATFASPIEFTYVRTRTPIGVLAFDVQAVYRPKRLGFR